MDRHPVTPATLRPAVVAACAALVVATSGCAVGKDAVDTTSQSQFRYTDATKIGDVVPMVQRKMPGKVTGTLLDGGTYSLADDAGKVVVVNLWGSWCAPCRIESPEFEQVYQQTRSQGVDFVGFAVKESTENDTKEFVSMNDITYPIVYDQQARVALQLGRLPTQGLPLTVLVDRQGRVAATYLGQIRPSQLKPALAQLTAES